MAKGSPSGDVWATVIVMQEAAAILLALRILKTCKHQLTSAPYHVLSPPLSYWRTLSSQAVARAMESEGKQSANAPDIENVCSGEQVIDDAWVEI